MPGRHASPAGPSFYRDLLTMVGGILAVAVLVYLGLTAISNGGSTGTTAGSTSSSGSTIPASTSATTTTSTPVTTTTARPATTTASTSTTAAIRPPAEVTVQVLNAKGVAGLAAQVTAELEELGYQVLTPDNYEPALSQSRVWYTSGFEPEAFELAAQFPDALVEEAAADLEIDADIVVVLGESFEPGG